MWAWPSFGTHFGTVFWRCSRPSSCSVGLFSGLFTPTEGAAVTNLYALTLGLVVYRTLSFADVGRVLRETAETAGVVMPLVMSAGALGWCLSASRIPQIAAPAMLASISHPLLFLLTCNLLLLLVGCFMETLAAILILLPILVPAAVAFGIDPAQFAIMMIPILVLGTIHPPVGVVRFISSRIAEISYETLARAVLPWLIPLFCVLAAITLWPPITTWLPGLVLGR